MKWQSEVQQCHIYNALWRQPSKDKQLPHSFASFSLLLGNHVIAPRPERPSMGWDRRVLDAPTSSENLRNSSIHVVKVMTSLQPKLQVKNSVLPFTVGVSTCIVCHCFLYSYLYNFLSYEKEGNIAVSFAHRRLKRITQHI